MESRDLNKRNGTEQSETEKSSISGIEECGALFDQVFKVSHMKYLFMGKYGLRNGKKLIYFC
jgi:hypothetical protein